MARLPVRDGAAHGSSGSVMPVQHLSAMYTYVPSFGDQPEFRRTAALLLARAVLSLRTMQQRLRLIDAVALVMMAVTRAAAQSPPALILRGGTVVDGTDAGARHADIAIRSGMITSVVPRSTRSSTACTVSISRIHSARFLTRSVSRRTRSGRRGTRGRAGASWAARIVHRRPRKSTA